MDTKVSKKEKCGLKDLIIGVLAFNPRYWNKDNVFSWDTFYGDVVFKDYSEKPILMEAGLERYDFPTIRFVLDSISHPRGPLANNYIPSSHYSWDFFMNPKEYFDRWIKPKLTENQIEEIKKIRLSRYKK